MSWLFRAFYVIFLVFVYDFMPYDVGGKFELLLSLSPVQMKLITHTHASINVQIFTVEYLRGYNLLKGQTLSLFIARGFSGEMLNPV